MGPDRSRQFAKGAMAQSRGVIRFEWSDRYRG